MSNFAKTFSSSLGKKLVMALTGIFLCTFLVVHLVGNLQLFKDDAGQAFNAYAYFMTHFGPIKIVSYLLYASIIIHAVYALLLTAGNKKARPVAYAVQKGGQNSPWSSRNMGILGTILLIFIVVHMGDFWWKYHNAELPYAKYEISLDDPKVINVTEIPYNEKYLVHSEIIDVQARKKIIVSKDLYKIVNNAFQTWWYVLLYVVAMAALSFHLIHGFKSAFQTIGWNNSNLVPIIRFLGVWVFGVLIPLAFAAMPLYFFFK
ncbi:succinate dehydrogenase cytochrome b subunit [Daejeonella sp.]|uniref:succinate dehydrogenase cytochrome b subunit n=1 Tax=Daejeonella sp. TaxID=2805397 RepID=UPI0027B87EDC|nr:succinate dehydrogenase cytochrome b subunit [Daejeonella sp.]